MITVGLALEDNEAPRTVFYDLLLKAVRGHPQFRHSGAPLVIPNEDTAQETNWPRYDRGQGAYVRGAPHDLAAGGHFDRYLRTIVDYARNNPSLTVLVVNMEPWVRLPLLFRTIENVIVADAGLAWHERALNPRTIGMPALPMVAAAAGGERRRDIVASFRGAPSHPVRLALATLATQPGFEVSIVDPKEREGKVDALAGRTDASYEELIDRSVFSLVPRGDALFTYRMLEVMARGSIPVILADGWVLPLDRIIDWNRISLRFHHDAVPQIPEMLRSLGEDEIRVMQLGVRQTYAERLAGLPRIVESLLAEAELLI